MGRWLLLAGLLSCSCAVESESEPVGAASAADQSTCANSPHACPLYGRCTWGSTCVAGSCGEGPSGAGYCEVVPSLWWPGPYNAANPSPPYAAAWVPIDYCCE